MKKIFLLLALSIPGIANAIGTNWVYNKTGKTVTITFKTSYGTWAGTEIILPTGPVPQEVDMHNLTSSKMYVGNASLKTPKVGDLHDYEINLDSNKKITFKKLKTIMGIPDGSSTNSGNNTAAPVISSEEQLARLQKENSDMTADNKTRQDHMNKLSNDIKRLRKKGAVGSMNNRKDMRAKEDDKIKSNTKKIAENNAKIMALQTQIASSKVQAAAQGSSQARLADPNSAFAQSLKKDASANDTADSDDSDADDTDSDDSKSDLQASGGTVVMDPVTGTTKTLGCSNGICPLVKVVS